MSCTEPAPEVASSAPSGIRLLIDDGASDFARAVGAHDFTFPRDHGSHESYRTEWWYFTGNLRAQEERHFGFELTFFRYALGSRSAEQRSAWATNQIWMAHLALTDTARGRFDTAERLSRGALELAGARHDRFEVWVENWSARQDDERGPIRLDALTDTIAIELTLEPTKAIVLHGDHGLDQKGPEAGNASYYYSWPRLAARGRVTPSGAAPMTVEGLVWLDREWGTSTLSAGAVGWDWFALQLDDGRDLMFYRLRDANGQATRWSGGTMVGADGSSERLGAQDATLEILEDWRSPTTGIRYPIRWRLQVESQGLDLIVRPVIANQEVDLSVRYWEGAVIVESADAPRRQLGEGYLELAGYARE